MSLVLLNGLENYTYIYYPRGGKGKIKEGNKKERMRRGVSVRGGKGETTIL